MGFKAGDEKLLMMRRWTGWAFHYYTRRIVSDASKSDFWAEAISVVLRLRAMHRRARSLHTFPRRDAHRGSAYRRRFGSMAAWHVRPGQSDFKGIQPPDHRNHRERMRLSRCPPMKKNMVAYRMSAESNGTAKLLAELARAIADGARFARLSCLDLLDQLPMGGGFIPSAQWVGFIPTFATRKRTIRNALVGSSCSNQPHHM